MTGDPYSVACPDCGQAAGQPCVYMPLKGVDPDFAHYRARIRIQARIALTGSPTKQPHNGRRDAARKRVYRRAELARFRLLREQGRAAEASPTRREIARAEQEYDRLEYQQLRAWFARNAGILISDTGR